MRINLICFLQSLAFSSIALAQMSAPLDSNGIPISNPYKVYAGVVESCPFKAKEDKSLNELLDSVKSSMRQLANDCPQLNEKVKQAESRLQISLEPSMRMSDNGMGPAFLTSARSPNPSLEGLQINCANFKTLLTREHEIAVSRVGVLGLPSRYSECKGDDVQTCIDKRFMLSMKEANDTCKSTGATRVQEELGARLLEAAETFSSLIRESNQCPVKDRTPQLLLNTGSAFLDTIATVSGGFGLTGVISGFLAKTMGAILDSQVMKNSPKVGVRQLEDEVKFDNLACVWFQLQNRNLHCQEYQNEKLARSQVERPLCNDYLDRNLGDDIYNLKMLVKNFNQAGVNAGTDINQGFDNMTQLLNKKISHPTEGKGKATTIQEHLEEISQTLVNSKMQKDKEQGRKLRTVLESSKKLHELEAKKDLTDEARIVEENKIK
ncbi:MAG: hypothetical protein H7061_14540, partial [Bdellovibrionaceae bacterium]|nr:hypothetical protein [Bdellovibrio sp.]